MNQAAEKALAELKAAAYKLAAELGYREAIDKVQGVAAELRNSNWDGR